MIGLSLACLPWIGLSCGLFLTIGSLTSRLNNQRTLSIGVDLTCFSILLLIVQFNP